MTGADVSFDERPAIVPGDAVKVSAVVVTYNRKHLLGECLDAVLAQTRAVDHLYVIDNASTDGTPEFLRERGYLDRRDLTHVRLDQNVGGAGGFAEGVSVGRQAQSDWLWLTDDDSEPRPDTLERMLSAPPASDPGTVSLCPTVLYPDGRLDSNQRGDFQRRLRSLPESAYVAGRYPAIGYMSFVGSLVRVDVARLLEPPRAEFFVWGDDVEYSLRLRHHGDIRLVPESVIIHKRSSRTYMNARSRFWNTVLPVQFVPTPLERFWQNLYGLRNYIWMKRTYERQSSVSACGTALQFVIKHLLYDEQPLRRIPWILRYARHGREGKFENIPPSRWIEMVRRGEV